MKLELSFYMATLETLFSRIPPVLISRLMEIYTARHISVWARDIDIPDKVVREANNIMGYIIRVARTRCRAIWARRKAFLPNLFIIREANDNFVRPCLFS